MTTGAQPAAAARVESPARPLRTRVVLLCAGLLLALDGGRPALAGAPTGPLCADAALLADLELFPYALPESRVPEPCAGQEVLAAGPGSPPLPAAAAPGLPCPRSWSLWSTFARRFVQADGRVLDDPGGETSSSLGQAQALFFALVTNDRPRFERLLWWTENALARGDLNQMLPARLWGKRPDGNWGVLDGSSSGEADLWLSYVLLEAGRLWQEPTLATLGGRVLRRTAAEEVLRVDWLGALLLPASHGARLQAGRWRINPSHAPLQLLRHCATAHPEGPWQQLRQGQILLLEMSTPHGYIADWVSLDRTAGFAVDPVAGPGGGADALRTQLWVDLLDPGDPLAGRASQLLTGVYERWRKRGIVPERVDAWSGTVAKATRSGPAGFYAALLPRASRERRDLVRLSRRIETQRLARALTREDLLLLLFGQGFVEQRYRFDVGGALQPAWHSCRAALGP